MKIIALSTLKAFWENDPSHADAIQPLLAWYRHALKANWTTPAEVSQSRFQKRQHPEKR